MNTTEEIARSVLRTCGSSLLADRVVDRDRLACACSDLEREFAVRATEAALAHSAQLAELRQEIKDMDFKRRHAKRMLTHVHRALG